MSPSIVLGIIPARGGSKSVLGKNLHPLGGRPLIEHTIVSALAAKSLDRVIVSTDDPEIARVARAAGAEVPFMRPGELARDDTPDLPVFQHVLAALEEGEGYRPDVVVHLRPTQPFRTAAEIDAVVALMLESGADCVKSIRLVAEHPYKMYRLVGERLVPYLDTPERRRRGRRPGLRFGPFDVPQERDDVAATGDRRRRSVEGQLLLERTGQL